MNTTETDLIFERYTQTKILSEDMNGQYAPEDAPEDDQFGGMEPEEDESVGDFDEFIGKAEKFVDTLSDDQLEFMMSLSLDNIETLMSVIGDESGYRSQGSE